MNSRERALVAFDHKAGDRIPIDFWATDSVARTVERALGTPYPDFLDRYGVDFRYIPGPRYIGPPLDASTDIWGVRRETIGVGRAGNSELYSDVLAPPLAGAQSVAEVENYPHWPAPDMFDYSVIAGQCEDILRQNRAVVFMGDRLNRIAQLKPAMYLRGAENIFMDMALNPEVARAIFGRINKFYAAYLERILAAAGGRIDVVLTGDDFGAQNGLLAGAGMWREFIRPGFADYIGRIRRAGAVSMHHTCGAVAEIIPDMIDCGLQVLQSIQPEAAGMSLAALKREFGRDLCFHGGVSIQKTMPYGSAKDVRNEVRRIAGIVKPDGGYVFCTSHNIQADTPVKNILALLDAYREFGRY